MSMQVIEIKVNRDKRFQISFVIALLEGTDWMSLYEIVGKSEWIDFGMIFFSFAGIGILIYSWLRKRSFKKFQKLARKLFEMRDCEFAIGFLAGSLKALAEIPFWGKRLARKWIRRYGSLFEEELGVRLVVR